MQVSHSNLNNNTLIKIINPKNNESLTIGILKGLNILTFIKF